MSHGYITQFLLSSAHDVMKLVFAVLYVSLNDGPYMAVFLHLYTVSQKSSHL